jgi:type IV secretion system protein VirD4
MGVNPLDFLANAAQLSIYGAQANTLVDNAGVLQIFGARNNRMAQEFANLVGDVSADDIMKMRQDEQILLIEGKPLKCRQARYYSDEHFRTP